MQIITAGGQCSIDRILSAGSVLKPLQVVLVVTQGFFEEALGLLEGVINGIVSTALNVSNSSRRTIASSAYRKLFPRFA